MANRILLKLSGESLTKNQSFGLNPEACQEIASAIQKIHQEGYQIGLVIGGGNIFRGMGQIGMPRTPADQIGMLATIMNGIALQQALIPLGCPTRVLSALDCPKVVESYNWKNALEYLSKGEIVIFVGGTGNPYFTTDTAAALRASEIQADYLLKATKVNGVYNKDPLKYKDAVKYDVLSYSQFLAEKLEVMDATSVTLCRNSQTPILVFNMEMLGKESITALLRDKQHGTLVKGE